MARSTRREREQRQIRQAQDSLMAKLLEAAPSFADEFPTALHRFWNGKYTVDAVAELDDLEERGAERFLTWFVFDYIGEGGKTPLDA